MEQIVELLASEHLKSDVMDITPTFLPPKPSTASGPLLVGSATYGDHTSTPFGLRLHELYQHTMIVGRSGSGKTNTCMLLLKGLAELGTPWMLLDWKSTYRELLPHIPDMQVFTVGKDSAPFHFNPLIPIQGVDPKIYLKKLIDVISESYFTGEGVAYLLQKAIDHVYSKHGIYDDSITSPPTFRDVLKYLRAYKAYGRESLWLTSALRTVHSLCFGPADQVFNAGNGLNIEELLSRHIVIEVDALAHADKKMFVQCMMLNIHLFRTSQQNRETLTHVLAIEECQNILKRRNPSKDDSIVEVMIREIRETGQGLLFVGQMPSEISPAAFANTYTTICMNMKLQADVNAMANAMLLSRSQKEHLGRLPVGTAVVKLQDRIVEPFLLKVPEVSIRKGSVSDDILRQRMKPFIEEMPARIIALPDGESSFLKDIAMHPLSGVAARYKRLEISARQGDKIKHSLLDSGHISEAPASSPADRRKILRLTTRGRSALINPT